MVSREPGLDRGCGLPLQSMTDRPPPAPDPPERGHESLETAFAGTHGAFCVTFFWEHIAPAQEVAQARNKAEASRDTGVQHVDVWLAADTTRIPLE